MDTKLDQKFPLLFINPKTKLAEPTLKKKKKNSVRIPDGHGYHAGRHLIDFFQNLPKPSVGYLLPAGGLILPGYCQLPCSVVISNSLNEVAQLGALFCMCVEGLLV